MDTHFSRTLPPPPSGTLVFGAPGVGKTAWARQLGTGAQVFDLKAPEVAASLRPSDSTRLAELLGQPGARVVFDNLEASPELYLAVLPLLPAARATVTFTCGNRRALKAARINPARFPYPVRTLHPLTRTELGARWDLRQSLEFGQLPAAVLSPEPALTVERHLRQVIAASVTAKKVVRNAEQFWALVEALTASQAEVLNLAAIAAELGMERKNAERYLGVLEELMLTVRLAPFATGSGPRLVKHPKFYFYDAGVYRALSPKGPADAAERLDGPALETLVFQELRAGLSHVGSPANLYFWRTASGHEVDFIVHGPGVLLAINVHKTAHVRRADEESLRRFQQEHLGATAILVHPGLERVSRAGVEVMPVATLLEALPRHLSAAHGPAAAAPAGDPASSLGRVLVRRPADAQASAK